MGARWKAKPNRIWCLKMPTYEVFVDGKPKKIELTRTGEKTFIVKVDGKSISVELSNEKLESEKSFKINVNGKNYSIELPKAEKDRLMQIRVEEATFKVEVKAPAKKPESAAFVSSQLASTTMSTVTRQVVEGAVVAPMTGKILSVKVKKGESVKAGQILCVLEAMKMENEITAPKTGTIREVLVSEGSSVSEGEPLFIID
ncbi:MAG: biotin/lipoyl-containing protein [Candidatus Bathyarchaeia archaeon]